MSHTLALRAAHCNWSLEVSCPSVLRHVCSLYCTALLSHGSYACPVLRYVCTSTSTMTWLHSSSSGLVYDNVHIISLRQKAVRIQKTEEGAILVHRHQYISTNQWFRRLSRDEDLEEEWNGTNTEGNREEMLQRNDNTSTRRASRTHETGIPICRICHVL